MKGKRFDLRGVVLAWTLVTSTFAWTPTMRLLLAPEISQWSLFGLGGRGGEGPFWLLPLVATAVLFLFFLEGRGRLRPFFHLLLLSWHLPITATLLYWSVRRGSDAAFTGAAWGVTLSFPVLAAPFTLFSILAVLLVIRESRGELPFPVLPWSQIHRGKLVVAALLLPVAAIFFRLGEGFDLRVKVAIVATILQWILLAEALGHRPKGSELPTTVP